MDSFQAYIFLFNDSLLSSLFLMPRTAYAYEVMVTIGQYNAYLVFIVSFIAGIIGSAINWLIGYYIRKLEKLDSFSNRILSFNKAESFFNHKAKWIILLSAIPLWGAFITTIAGFMKFRFSHFMILTIFSKFIWLAFAIFG
jgi:membrane protein YqaA with SNARE-associated domain